MKNFLLQVLASFLSIPLWELFLILFKRLLDYNEMEHVSIFNLWFITFFVSVNLLFFSLSKATKKRRKQQTLDRLANLTNDPCFNPDIFFDKDACVKWANSVEVLLKGHSDQYDEWVAHRKTMFQTNDLFDVMGYLINQMRNMLDLAIKEIKEETTNKKTKPT